MIRWLPDALRSRIRRWITGPYDYRRAYRMVDLERDHWSIVGPATEAEFVTLGLGKAQMLRELGLRPDSRLLDVGCGTGQLAFALESFLSPAGAYLGTDIAPEAIAFCRRKFHQPNFQFVESEMTGVPISGQLFDFVYFGSVFTHMYIPEIRAMLEGLRPLLGSGGSVVADAFIAEVPSGSRGDRGRAILDEAGLLAAFSSAGFRPEVVQVWDCEPGVRRCIYRLRPAGDSVLSAPAPRA
jgi:SAM-dependent methyltransferase